MNHYVIGDVHGHYDTLIALVAKLPRDARLVFVGDRITNLASIPDYWNEEKRQNYAQEAQKILDALKGCNPYLEERLQYRIDNWGKHFR